MAELVDSGERTTFGTGAMREVLEDKGRCDLLPLKQIAEIYKQGSKDQTAVSIFGHLDSYIRTGNSQDLYDVLLLFMGDYYKLSYETGYETAMLDLAKHYQDGARKYADRNWEKGLPLHSFIDSGVRHYLKFIRGDTDEPHDRAFMWNIVGAIWTQENHPECVDLPFSVQPETKYLDGSSVTIS